METRSTCVFMICVSRIYLKNSETIPAIIFRQICVRNINLLPIQTNFKVDFCWFVGSITFHIRCILCSLVIVAICSIAFTISNGKKFIYYHQCLYFDFRTFALRLQLNYHHNVISSYVTESYFLLRILIV